MDADLCIIGGGAAAIVMVVQLAGKQLTTEPHPGVLPDIMGRPRQILFEPGDDALGTLTGRGALDDVPEVV